MTNSYLRDATGRFMVNEKPKTHKGYTVVYAPYHKHARQNGYVYEHILVVEKRLRRPLFGAEVVHHINGDKTDNRPENLEVFPSHAAHMRAHWAQRSTKYVVAEKEYTLRELAEKYQIPYPRLYQRIHRLNWAVERAVKR